jgi:hypothetical protein
MEDSTINFAISIPRLCLMKVSEYNLSQCHYVHQKSHMDYRVIEPGPPQREAGGSSPELWHGLKSSSKARDLYLGDTWFEA